MSNQPLLPSDHYLLQLLAESGVDITEDDWRSFKAEVRRKAREGPQPAVVNDLGLTLAIISLVSTLISIGLTIVASFFKPKPGRPAQLRGIQEGGQAANSQRRYAPRSGFDAVQEPAAIGSTIPLVYTLREPYGSGTYGGVRINMPLLWSQVQSYGRGQLLRAIFLLSEGAIHSLDPRNFAIGNNAISSYDLLSPAANELASRLTVYFRPNGGRIQSEDRVAGRLAPEDAGNAELNGASDVFMVERNGSWQPDFSSSTRPTTQTVFGIYSLIGNNLGYRINPVLRPTVQANLVPVGDKGDARVKCTIDQATSAQRRKYSVVFSGRSGLISGDVTAIGSEVVYRLDNTSDASTVFTTSEEGQEWGVQVQTVTSNSAQINSISQTTLKSLLTLDDPDFDTTNSTIGLTVTFNASLATTTFGPVVTQDGTYTLNYAIIFVDGNDPIDELEQTFTVTVNRSTTSELQLTSSGTYTSPTLVNNGGNSWSLVGGSATSNQYTLVTTTTYTYNPTTATYSFDYLKGFPAIEKCGDVASSVSSRQKSWDDAIVLGDLYKVGSALAICTKREPSDELFLSEADLLPYVADAGTAVEATFTTIRSGVTQLVDIADLRVDGTADIQPTRYTATNHPHLYRIALGNAVTNRACRTVEIGLRSNMGVRIGGLCNFTDSLTYDQINSRACLAKEGKIVSRGQTLKVDIFQSNSISSSEERFSFFRLSYREAGTDDIFTELAPCFGIRCITQQNIYNAIRLDMPEAKQWEFRFEPLSGWEIRSGQATGDLEVLDSKVTTTRSITNGEVTVTFHGIQVAREQATFALNSTRRAVDNEIGIGFTDGDSYVDAWGKLAEFFVYEEVQASAGNPEHEIVYINEIVSNQTTPNYDNLAIVGLNIRSSLEFQQFSQFSAYVTGGIECRRLLQGDTVGPSHLFPDVLLDILTNPRYGRGDLIPDELVDIDSFRASALWCQQRGYFFDGAVVGRENVRQWAADVAATNLLIFGEANGRFFLRPTFSFDPVPIRALFTAGNIREGSFKMQYLEAEERQPIQVSVKYREERAATNLANPGLFPVEREVLLREAITLENAPIESVDASDYATNPQHAIDAAKYIIRFRRTSTHGIRFETTYEGILTGLAPGDYIRVAMDTNVYDEFSNGIVTPEGVLVTTQTLADGDYPVVLWSGENAVPAVDGTLTVSAGGTRATPTGIVFTVKRPDRQVVTYQVESIEPSEEGYLAIEAVHMPTNAKGVLLLADGFNDEANWIIKR